MKYIIVILSIVGMVLLTGCGSVTFDSVLDSGYMKEYKHQVNLPIEKIDSNSFKVYHPDLGNIIIHRTGEVTDINGVHIGHYIIH